MDKFLGNNIRVITDNQEVMRRLDSGDVSQTDVIDNRGVRQKTNIVNEAGLYEVIIRSDKPEAKAEAEIEAQRPIAALSKAIETTEGDLTPSAFSKILSNTIKTMGPNKFCRWLLDNNFAFHNGQAKIIPMQDAVNRRIPILTERIDPAGKIRPQLLVTPTGQSYFAGILST